MARLAALILSFTFLMGSVVDLHDLAKLPYMVEHYQQHRNKSTGFSFSDFLNLHYGAKAMSHDKEEHERHKGLPFKTHHCTYAHVLTLLSGFKASEIVMSEATVLYTNFYQSAFSSSFSQSIWQPPRLS